MESDYLIFLRPKATIYMISWFYPNTGHKHGSCFVKIMILNVNQNELYHTVNLSAGSWDSSS